MDVKEIKVDVCMDWGKSLFTWKKFIELQKFAMKTPWNPNLFCSEDETNRTVNTSLNEQVKSLSAQVWKKGYV